MPQTSKAIKAPNNYPSCGHTAYIIQHSDGFGVTTDLEIHCNQCGWAIDAENGNIRNPGRELSPLGSFRGFSTRKEARR